MRSETHWYLALAGAVRLRVEDLPSARYWVRQARLARLRAARRGFALP